MFTKSENKEVKTVAVPTNHACQNEANSSLAWYKAVAMTNGEKRTITANSTGCRSTSTRLNKTWWKTKPDTAAEPKIAGTMDLGMVRMVVIFNEIPLARVNALYQSRTEQIKKWVGRKGS